VGSDQKRTSSLPVESLTQFKVTPACADAIEFGTIERRATIEIPISLL
jgi:hypothetical protein